MFQRFKARLTAAASSASRDGLRRVSRRALWLLDLDDALAPPPNPEPFFLPPFDDDMRRVKIHRAGPQRGKVEDLPVPPTPSSTHPETAPAPPDPCIDRSSGQVNTHPRVTLTPDRVIIDIQESTPDVVSTTPPPGAKPRKAKKMSKDKQELSFEGEMPVEKIITYLRGLADGLAEGTVPVESGLDRVILEAAPSMTMKIKAKVKKRDNALKIELAWTTPEGVGLKIGGEADK